MRNSSLHSFSLRLHFHAQYLQNKAYKHLMAKILPEQLGYLAPPAPSHFPNASRVLLRRRGGKRVTHANPIRRSSVIPRRAATTRGTRAAPAACPRRGDDGGAAPRRSPPAPGWLPDGTTPTALPGHPPAPGQRQSPGSRKEAGSRRPRGQPGTTTGGAEDGEGRSG